MLRIHVEETCESVTIRVEGKIAGEWVPVLEKCCRDALVRPQHPTIVIELDEVMTIDLSAEELLRRMHRAGIEIRGRGIHSQYLVDRIQGLMVS